MQRELWKSHEKNHVLEVEKSSYLSKNVRITNTSHKNSRQPSPEGSISLKGHEASTANPEQSVMDIFQQKAHNVSLLCEVLPAQYSDSERGRSGSQCWRTALKT